MSRSSWWLLIRIVITLCGVGYLCLFKNWSDIFLAAREASPRWLLIAFVSYGATTFLGVWRWHILLVNSNVGMSLARTTQLTLIGLFANTFMPGAMGGDLVKAVFAAKEAPSIKPTVVMSIIMERILGFLAMFLVSTTLILSRIGPLTSEHATRYAVILYFIIFVLTLALLAIGAWGNIENWIPAFLKKNEKVQTSLSEAGTAYRFFLGHRSCFWGGLGLSIAAHMALMYSCYAVAMAMGLELDFWDLGAVLPLVALVMLMIPSLGGLAVRELAFQHFLTYVSITKETSIALSLLFFAITLSWGLLGGLVFLRFGHAKSSRAS